MDDRNFKRRSARSVWTVALLLAACRAGGCSCENLEEVANQCRFDDALAMTRDMSPLFHSRAETAVLRARLLLQLDRFDEVLSELVGIPPDADVLLLKGLALAGAKRHEEAVVTLESAAKAGADPGLVAGAMGVAAADVAAWDEADRVLTEELTKDPTLTGALYNLACIRSVQGRLEEADALVRRAWSAGWRDVRTLKRDPDLEAVRQAGRLGDLLSRDDTEGICTTW